MLKDIFDYEYELSCNPEDYPTSDEEKQKRKEMWNDLFAVLKKYRIRLTRDDYCNSFYIGDVGYWIDRIG